MKHNLMPPFIQVLELSLCACFKNTDTFIMKHARCPSVQHSIQWNFQTHGDKIRRVNLIKASFHPFHPTNSNVDYNSWFIHTNLFEFNLRPRKIIKSVKLNLQVNEIQTVVWLTVNSITSSETVWLLYNYKLKQNVETLMTKLDQESWWVKGCISVCVSACLCSCGHTHKQEVW